MKTRAREGAFTLIELLVVIGIIALLATIGIGAIRGFSATNVVAAGNRQLLDDINMARNYALAQRTTVYMVFVPALVDVKNLNPTALSDFQKKQLTNRFAGQFNSYNFVTMHSPGDQPGHGTARYLGDWRNLPEGVFIAPPKFAPYSEEVVESWFSFPLTNRPLPRIEVPFPTAKSPKYYLPCLAFSYRGELLGPKGTSPRRADEFLYLSRGSLVYPKDASGKWLFDVPEMIETPQGNSTNNPYVRIDWLTGRPRIEERRLL